jgi:bifunctional non-homologous end joining protein LigD
MGAERTLVEVDGRRLSLSNLDRILYPRSGTTKAAVIQYYTQVASAMLPHLTDRPASFLRCPEGVEGQRFWAKNMPLGAPEWVRVLSITHRSTTLEQPVVDDLATLVWAANLAALEIHTPQWREDPARHDRLIIDLDPGEGTTMVHCCAAALATREALAGDGLESFAKTSGSKGLHLTVALRPVSAEAVNSYARRLAQRMASAYPELLVHRMGKHLRRGRVLLDWSQNNSAKTTVAPYSLRAQPTPTVSAPVTWEEVAACRDPEGLVFEAADIPTRLRTLGDLLAPLGDPAAEQALPS